MQSEVPDPTHAEVPMALPSVAPPSGRHIVQLFLVPGIIVTIFVLAYVGWKRFTVSWYTPEAFLQKLDNPDPDVRWRAADSLAQVLLRDDALASNPQFALDLAERLRQALEAAAPAERAYAEQSGKTADTERSNERKLLDGERAYVDYLTACLGNFTIPVAVPLLNHIVTAETGAEPTVIARRLRRAVSALANLGVNVKRFDKRSVDEQQAVLSALEQQGSSGDRAQWASATLQFLRARSEQRSDAMGVDVALGQAASDRDPFVREMTAVAFNYWTGSAEENARIEATLLKLLHDSGLGADDKTLGPLFHDEEGHGVDDDPKRWSLVIRAQAAVALVRRGSHKMSLELVADLLDGQKQLQDFRRKLPDGRDAPDEAAAYATISNMLKAVVDLHREEPGRDLTPLVPTIRQLVNSANFAVRTEAEKTLIALGKK